MNKKGFWKVLMVSLVMASAIGLLARGTMAQNIPTQVQLSDELGLQIGGTILLDNFQYWTSPRDMGWTPAEPAYPIWGAGIGYGTAENVVDFQEGSRVMDVYCPPSVFMQMGGANMMPYTIAKAADYRDGNGVEHEGVPGVFNNLSFKLRAPLAVELFDTFRVIVRVRTWAGTAVAGRAPSPGAGTVNTYPAPATGPVIAGEDLDGDLILDPGEDRNGNGVLDEDTNGNGVLDPLEDLNANGQIDPLATIAGTAVPVEVPYGATQVGCPTCVAAPAFGMADIVLTPRDFPAGCTPAARVINNPLNAAGGFAANSPERAFYAANGQVNPNASPLQVQVAMGREFQDGSWHFVSENLNTFINAVSPTENIFQIVSVTFRGNQFRVDDLLFTVPGTGIDGNTAPYLFRVGPVYGMLFNMQQTRAIFAEDPDFFWLYNNAALRNNPSTALAAVGINTANLPDNTGFSFLAGASPEQAVFVDVRTASVPNPAAGAGSLAFITTVGDALGPMTQGSSLSTPVALPQLPTTDNNADLAINVLDIPNRVVTMEAFMQSLVASGIVAIPAMNVPSQSWIRNIDTAGTFAVATNPMYVYVCALINSGYRTMPNVQLIRASGGQVLEDMIITCRVEDGIAVDSETFPISVINYPMTNYPPVIEQLEDQFFQVGVPGVYQITATDPDSFTSLGAVPNAGVADVVTLTYKATLNGIPNYQYGPWMNSIINPITGRIQFVPQFEGSMTCIVTVSDARGASAVGHFNIFAVNPGTWLNHAPAVLEIIESPQTVRAGQMLVLNDLNIADPDGEQLYYSCNIGSVGRNGVFAFQSEFPGEYLVQITAYDIRGGAVTQQFVLQVLPWWSF